MMLSVRSFCLASALPPSPAKVERLLKQNGGVLVSRAEIHRGEPDAGFNTLIVARPREIHTMTGLSKPCLLVVPQNGWVTGQIMLSDHQIAEFGDHNEMAMLPSEVTILQIDGHGNLHVRDSHKVNYVQSVRK